MTFSEEVTVSGSAQLPLILGGSTVQAAYVSNPGAVTTAVFRYTVVAGDNDDNGVEVTADTLTAGGGTISDGAGNNAVLAHAAIDEDVSQLVDTMIPVINTIAFSTVGPYVLNNAIEVTVTFSEAVTVSGVPQLPLILGSSTVQAAYVSNPDATTAVFRYTVVAGDNDDDGVSIAENTLGLNGGTIRDGADNDAVLNHDAIDADAQQRVDTMIPAINTIEFSTTGPYALDDAIEVTVTFSEEVTVDTDGGVPQLPLTLGSSTVQAAYVSNPGAVTTAVFRYTVVDGDNDDNGVEVALNTLTAGGGTIRDGADNDAVLNHDAIDADAQQRVDSDAPTLSDDIGVDAAVVDATILTLTYNEGTRRQLGAGAERLSCDTGVRCCAEGEKCVDQRADGDVDAERRGGVRRSSNTDLYRYRRQQSGAGCGGQRCRRVRQPNGDQQYAGTRFNADIRHADHRRPVLLRGRGHRRCDPAGGQRRQRESGIRDQPESGTAAGSDLYPGHPHPHSQRHADRALAQ